MYEAEAVLGARNWEKKNSDFAFQEINQKFLSQRFQLHQANRWVDQAQTEKISVCGELEMRNSIYQGSHTRTCQAIEE